jgi:hypothetical protein
LRPAPLAETVAAEPDELLHDRQHRVSDPLGLRLERVVVELVRVAVPFDLRRGFGRDDPQPGLHAREGGLDVEVVLYARLVGEDAAHRLGAEDVAKDS